MSVTKRTFIGETKEGFFRVQPDAHVEVPEIFNTLEGLSILWMFEVPHYEIAPEGEEEIVYDA